jgi:arylsulfatase A-like enzyme
LKEIWDFVQSDPQYRNKTTILFTTDHGRGDKTKSKWNAHGSSVEDSHEIWFAAMGPNTPALGELKTEGLLYQKQFAQTMAKLMGLTFKAEHPVAEEIKTVIKK